MKVAIQVYFEYLEPNKWGSQIPQAKSKWIEMEVMTLEKSVIERVLRKNMLSQRLF